MDFNNEYPIYLQIVTTIKNNIIAGSIKPGAKLLSVREYASLYKVNPNTMQKALQELEDNKIIYTERTNGKYVTKDTKLINDIKKQNIDSKINTFIQEMADMGLTNDEIIKYIKERG